MFAVTFLVCRSLSSSFHVKALEEGCGGVLTSVDHNLVDVVWADKRPPSPNSDLIVLALQFAGSINIYILVLCCHST